MALIDRIRERTGTDLSDDELTAMIAGIAAEIEVIYGAASGAIEITLGDPGDPADRERWQRTLKLTRPAQPGSSIQIVEIDRSNVGVEDVRTVLSELDFRVLHGGRTLQRLVSGPNPETFWAPLVELTYTPTDAVTSAARDEVTIKLIQLDLSYRGLIKSERAGDYQWAGSVSSDSYATEREKLLASLGAGRSGMVMA
jgi:hypothetical protein